MTDQIRTHFPALQRQVNGRPVAYFDGPGGTQVPSQVADAMTDYLLRHNANTHWRYATSRETDEIIASSRGAMADFLGCEPDEVIFGANMTTLTFHVARAIGRTLARGDELVVTDLDHQANVAPWVAAAKDFGAVVRTVPMTLAGELDLDVLDRSINEKTRVVAVGAASNALGTIPDLKPIIAAARDVGSLVFVDAVHYAPHRLVDFRKLGADLVACSPYKFYGPHLGVLAGKKRLLEGLDVPKLDPAPDSAPERLETGTLSHEAIAGATAAVNFLVSIGDGSSRRERLKSAFDRLHQSGKRLMEQLLTGLAAIDGVKLYGPGPDKDRTPTVSFIVDGVASSKIASQLSDEWGVFVSHGDFYASKVVETLGLQPEGLVRAGCACYTTEEEVDRLVEGVQTIVSG